MRVTATTPGTDVPLTADADDAPRRTRRDAVLDGEERELEVLCGVPAPGTSLTGPAVVELPESTLLIPGGWAGAVMDTGTIRLEREA